VTTDAAALVARDDVDIVVEVIGGIEAPSAPCLLSALRSGKSVVSANKALLAETARLFTMQRHRPAPISTYEAAVAGAIPLLRPCASRSRGDRITRIIGIVNGTPTSSCRAWTHRSRIR